MARVLKKEKLYRISHRDVLTGKMKTSLVTGVNTAALLDGNGSGLFEIIGRDGTSSFSIPFHSLVECEGTSGEAQLKKLTIK